MSLCRIIVIFYLIFAGCSSSDLHTQSEKVTTNDHIPQKKSFVLYQNEEILIEAPKDYNSTIDYEDSTIITALNALDENDLSTSAKLFYELWETTKQYQYLKQSLGIRLEASRFNTLSREDIKALLSDIDIYLKIDPKSQDVRRTLVAILIAIKDNKKAQIEAQKLVKIEENEENYELLGSVFLVSNETKKAEKALMKAYGYNQSALVLERLISVLNTQQAIALLETHTRFKGCEERLCFILAEVYRKNKNFKRLEEIYTKIYEQNPEKENLESLLSIVLHNKNFSKATMLLEEHLDYNKPLLLELYVEQNQYQKALLLAQELYRETHDNKYMIIEIMVEYESLKQPLSNKKLLNPIIEKLKHIIENGKADDLVYNFLGYILIDHQVNIQEGIEFVKKALHQKPNVPAYLDSLGWGYYHLNECTKAMEIFEQIPAEERNKEEEIQDHYNSIQECLAKEKKP